VVFYDEAHTTLFSRVGKTVLYKTHPHAVHLAMTATPERLGKDQLGEHLETLVSAPIPGELQAMGFLSQMKYFSMPPDGIADLKEVKTVRGDYDEVGLKNACDRPELVIKIVQEWQRLTPGKRTISFCVDVEHAHHVADAFIQAGIPADTVEGSTPIKERQRMYADLRHERILVLTSCNVISIGFDEPSVEVGLLLRPTQSSALHIQQIGRVMRISPQTGKQFGIILDQAGNLERLGFPEDIEEYQLPMRKDGSGSGKPPPMKACPQCGRMVLSFVVRCPECDHQWLSERPVNLEDMVQIYSREQAHAIRDLPTLIEIFHSHRRRIFKSGYAIYLAERDFFEHTGRTARPEWCLGSLFGQQPSWEQKQVFLEYLQHCARRVGKPAVWIMQEFEREFGADTWADVSRLQSSTHRDLV
jgi:superfamily II DNA or RNA helicase